MSEDDDDRAGGFPGRVLGRVIGSVVNPIVESVDVDEVVERIDVDQLLDEVDVNRLLDQIDTNRLLDRVDANRLLDRVDPNALLDRVDANRLLDRVDPNALLDRVEPDRVLDRVDANRLIDRVDPGPLVDRVEPDALLDRVDVDRLITRIDLDALLDRIDPNALLDRIDANALLARVDVDQLLAGVDPNPFLERVDVDTLMERVDVNSLVERTELGAVIARSTTGVFSGLLDVVRAQIVAVDQLAQGIPARVLRGARRELPPAPGGTDDHVDPSSMSTTERAVAVQGRVAGSVSRFLAFLVDQFAIGVLFGLGATLIRRAIEVVTRTTLDADQLDRLQIPVVIAYGLWAFAYTAGSLAAAGQTIGKTLLGLLVVRSDGSRLDPKHAALRTVVFPLSFLLLGIGFLLGLFRHDRRQLHDLIADTAVVYAWDAQTALLRAEAVQAETSLPPE